MMEPYIGQSTGMFGYPQSTSSYAQSGDAVNRSEVTDRRALSPLLTDFDGTIQRLNSRIDSYQEQQKELRSQVDKLVAENDRLSQKLKDAARVQIESSGRNNGTGGDDDGVLSNLQQQLTLALREKEAAVDMWQASMLEIEKLEKQLQTARLDPRMQSLELQAQQIKDQYVRTVNDLSQQTAQLQEELKKTKNDLKVSNIQVIDLRNALEELRNEMMLKEQQRVANETSRSSVEKNFKDLNKQLSDLNSQLVTRSLEIDQLRSEKQMIEQQLSEFRSKASESECRSAEAMNKLRGSFQMVENAITERDEALLKEKQAQEEIVRLQEAISKLLDEAGIRTRQEVDNVKKQCNVNLSKLVDEVQRLELESSEKQAELERAVREKRAVENELEKVYKEGIMQGSRDGLEYNDLTLRACNAEKNLDEAQLKIDSLSNQIRRMEIMHHQGISSLEIELESIQDRYKVNNEELSSTNDDRVRLTEKVDDLKQQLHKLQQERNSSARTLSKQVAVLSQELQVKEKEYEAKLQSLEDCHRQKVLEMRDMLIVQQRMSAKWKEECNTITQKMESKLTESQNELKNERRRTEELTRLLRDCRNKTVEMEAKMQQYSRNMQAMENKFITVEQTSGTSRKWHHQEKTSTSSFIESRRQQQRELEFNLRHSMSPLNCMNGSS